MLMSGTLIVQDIYRHIRVISDMSLIGGELLLQVVSKRLSTICTQVFVIV
jgi:hypothetical protein